MKRFIILCAAVVQMTAGCGFIESIAANAVGGAIGYVSGNHTVKKIIDADDAKDADMEDDMEDDKK